MGQEFISSNLSQNYDIFCLFYIFRIYGKNEFKRFIKYQFDQNIDVKTSLENWKIEKKYFDLSCKKNLKNKNIEILLQDSYKKEEKTIAPYYKKYGLNKRIWNIDELPTALKNVLTAQLRVYTLKGFIELPKEKLENARWVGVKYMSIATMFREKLGYPF